MYCYTQVFVGTFSCVAACIDTCYLIKVISEIPIQNPHRPEGDIFYYFPSAIVKKNHIHSRGCAYGLFYVKGLRMIFF